MNLVFIFQYMKCNYYYCSLCGRFCSNSSKTVKDVLKKNLMCKFQMKDLGAVSYCLGIKTVRVRKNGTLKLS
jgi:hypothetical protein